LRGRPTASPRQRSARSRPPGALLWLLTRIHAADHRPATGWCAGLAASAGIATRPGRKALIGRRQTNPCKKLHPVATSGYTMRMGIGVNGEPSKRTARPPRPMFREKAPQGIRGGSSGPERNFARGCVTLSEALAGERPGSMSPAALACSTSRRRSSPASSPVPPDEREGRQQSGVPIVVNPKTVRRAARAHIFHALLHIPWSNPWSNRVLNGPFEAFPVLIDRASRKQKAPLFAGLSVEPTRRLELRTPSLRVKCS